MDENKTNDVSKASRFRQFKDLMVFMFVSYCIVAFIFNEAYPWLAKIGWHTWLESKLPNIYRMWANEPKALQYQVTYAFLFLLQWPVLIYIYLGSLFKFTRVHIFVDETSRSFFSLIAGSVFCLFVSIFILSHINGLERGLCIQYDPYCYHNAAFGLTAIFFVILSTGFWVFMGFHFIFCVLYKLKRNSR